MLNENNILFANDTEPKVYNRLRSFPYTHYATNVTQCQIKGPGYYLSSLLTFNFLEM